VVVVFGSVTVGDVVVGEVDVFVPSVPVASCSIDTLPRFSPQADTPAEAPTPRAAATARIPAFRSTGLG
jgi:hypothetical protein